MPEMRVTSTEQLDSLPPGTIYRSDSNCDVVETKHESCWYVDGSESPFEPAFPGRALTPAPAKA